MPAIYKINNPCKCGSKKVIIHPNHDGWLHCLTCMNSFVRPEFIQAIKNNRDARFHYKEVI